MSYLKYPHAATQVGKVGATVLAANELDRVTGENVVGFDTSLLLHEAAESTAGKIIPLVEEGVEVTLEAVAPEQVSEVIEGIDYVQAQLVNLASWVIDDPIQLDNIFTLGETILLYSILSKTGHVLLKMMHPEKTTGEYLVRAIVKGAVSYVLASKGLSVYQSDPQALSEAMSWGGAASVAGISTLLDARKALRQIRDWRQSKSNLETNPTDETRTPQTDPSDEKTDSV